MAVIKSHLSLGLFLKDSNKSCLITGSFHGSYGDFIKVVLWAAECGNKQTEINKLDDF